MVLSDNITTTATDYASRCLLIPGKYLAIWGSDTSVSGKRFRDDYFTSKINSIPSCLIIPVGQIIRYVL